MKKYIGVQIPSVYKEYDGKCRNEDNDYDELGTDAQESHTECQKKCDETEGCGAVSWNGNTCFMTSLMATTSLTTGWKCYSKGS